MGVTNVSVHVLAQHTHKVRQPWVASRAAITGAEGPCFLWGDVSITVGFESLQPHLQFTLVESCLLIEMCSASFLFWLSAREHFVIPHQGGMERHHDWTITTQSLLPSHHHQLCCPSPHWIHRLVNNQPKVSTETGTQGPGPAQHVLHHWAIPPTPIILLLNLQLFRDCPG